jgi:uncharacterized membrane protein YqjE
MDDQSAKDEKKAVSLTLTSEDIKLLVVTFAGTVAANLITVLLLGLAIIIGHSFHPTGRSFWPYGILLAMTAMAVISVLAAISTWRRSRDVKETSFEYKAIRGALAVMGLSGVFMLLLFMLAWIGIAAGIK